MQSAPASIPATTPAAFTSAFGHGTLRCCPSRSCSPARSASRITGTRPAEPIRFGSSKTAATLCDACICRMPLRTVGSDPRQVQSSRPTGASATRPTRHRSVDQG